MPSQACQLCHGSSIGEFSLSELNLPMTHYNVYWCMLQCLLSAFRFPCCYHAQQWGLSCYGLQYGWQAYVSPGDDLWLLSLCIEYIELFLPPSLEVGGRFMLLILLPPSHFINMVGHTALEGWQRVIQSLCLPYIVGWGLFQVMFHIMTQLIPNMLGY